MENVDEYTSPLDGTVWDCVYWALKIELMEQY